MQRKQIKLLLIIVGILIFASCATYYTKNIAYQDKVLHGQFEEADKYLESNKKLKKDRVKVLYHLNKGYVNRMMGDYQESIIHLTDADNMIEDYSRNLGAEALSLISNPMTKPYKVEDFENVMVNYYKAFDYINMNKFEDAIVECKRMNIKLNQLNDKYKDHKNRYQRDAFAHNLMGILYEADKDFNNAFIAYRNAYEAYKEDYVGNFGVAVPEQLKQDLMRSAYINGFFDELEFYEKEFETKYKHTRSEFGEAVIFWENGFGPVKSEWSINFMSTSRNGMFVLDNKELGLFFSFPMGGMSGSQASGLGSIRSMRVAFPKYIERKPVCTSANIRLGNENYKLQMAENINEIAFKTLHDRMVRELANSLLRLATKKAIEHAARSQDEIVGALIGIANAATEKADTRNWQTLPYSISYVRIPLKEGENSLHFSTRGGSGTVSNETFTFFGKKGKTHFHTFHSLESYPLRQF